MALRVLQHITAPENVESIQKDGLVAHLYEKGKKGVFLFEERSYVRPFGGLINPNKTISSRYYSTWTVTDKIAIDEVFLEKYALFDVTVDEKELLPDNVAEDAAIYQYIYPKSISPEAIKFRGIYDSVDVDKYPIFDKKKRSLCSKEESEKLWERTKKAIKAMGL